MAKIKDTPNLPASSRMQMPSTGGNSLSKESMEYGGLNKGGSKGSATGKVMSGAKGKGIKGSNPYC